MANTPLALLMPLLRYPGLHIGIQGILDMAYTITPSISLVWVGGFKPPASWFQARNSDQAELHPEIEISFYIC